MCFIILSIFWLSIFVSFIGGRIYHGLSLEFFFFSFQEIVEQNTEFHVPAAYETEKKDFLNEV